MISFDCVSILPQKTFQSINGNLWQHSLFVGNTSLDKEATIISVTCTRIIDVHKNTIFLFLFTQAHNR